MTDAEKLDELEDTPDDGIYETLHRRGWNIRSGNVNIAMNWTPL